jgi:excisionase family DNA binding protein
MNILEEMKGHAVTLVPLQSEITAQQAAELLNVSRSYVVGLIDKGTLPARMVGNHRRLPLKDVLAYKADTRAKRRQTLRELATHDHERMSCHAPRNLSPRRRGAEHPVTIGLSFRARCEFC